MKVKLNNITKFSIMVIMLIFGMNLTQNVNAASFRIGDKIQGIIEADFIISPDNWSSSVAVGLSTPESSENVNYSFGIVANGIFALDIVTVAQYNDYLSKVSSGYQGQHSPGSIIPDLDIISDGQDFYQTWANFTITGEQLTNIDEIMIIVDNSFYFDRIPLEFLIVNITISIERDDSCPICEECPENSDLTIPGYATISVFIFAALAINSVIMKSKKQNYRKHGKS